MSEPLTIHIDGASRGNPGPAAYAFVIERSGRPAVEEKGCLEPTTNNIAEYTALVRALSHAAELGGARVHVLSDSELLVKQMNGQYKVKNPAIKELYLQAKELARHFDALTLSHVPREDNRRADELCNEALDAAAGQRPARPSPKAKSGRRSVGADRVREAAVSCLDSAARHWANGGMRDLKPEDVWDQLWSILEENGLA